MAGKRARWLTSGYRYPAALHVQLQLHTQPCLQYAWHLGSLAIGVLPLVPLAQRLPLQNLSDRKLERYLRFVVLLALVVVLKGLRPDHCDIASSAMANTEQTFIIIKPDGVARGLVGEIIKRFEQKVDLCRL